MHVELRLTVTLDASNDGVAQICINAMKQAIRDALELGRGIAPTGVVRGSTHVQFDAASPAQIADAILQLSDHK
jgi:hypothetical protein